MVQGLAQVEEIIYQLCYPSCSYMYIMDSMGTHVQYHSGQHVVSCPDPTTKKIEKGSQGFFLQGVNIDVKDGLHVACIFNHCIVYYKD